MYNNHEYLGDGVYVSNDGYQLWLHVGSHLSAPVVAIEPSVLKGLLAYYEQTFGEGISSL